MCKPEFISNALFYAFTFLFSSSLLSGLLAWSFHTETNSLMEAKINSTAEQL